MARTTRSALHTRYTAPRNGLYPNLTYYFLTTSLPLPYHFLTTSLLLPSHCLAYLTSRRASSTTVPSRRRCSRRMRSTTSGGASPGASTDALGQVVWSSLRGQRNTIRSAKSRPTECVHMNPGVQFRGGRKYRIVDASVDELNSELNKSINARISPLSHAAIYISTP